MGQVRGAREGEEAFLYLDSSNPQNVNGKFHSDLIDEESELSAQGARLSCGASHSCQNWAAFLQEGVRTPAFVPCCGLIGQWLLIWSSSCAASSLGVSPFLPSVAADGIFIAVDTEAGFSQVVLSACPVDTYRPGAHSMHGSKAVLCGPTHAHLPRRGPWDQTVTMPLGKEVDVVAPVLSLCGALALGALLLCRWALKGNASHSLVHSLIHSSPTH